MATPQWIRQMLDARGIRFEPLHHREAYTAQRVAQQEHFSGHRVAKVVVVIADGSPAELILPATRHVDLEQVSKVLEAGDVRLATEEEMETFFDGCDAGAIPPLPRWKGVPAVMDRSLNVEGDILFQAGTHEDAIRLDFRDWFELVEPQVASFTTPAEPAGV